MITEYLSHREFDLMEKTDRNLERFLERSLKVKDSTTLKFSVNYYWRYFEALIFEYK